jgi:truncated hemoglobin YjbI
MKFMIEEKQYGHNDTTYKAIGGKEGLRSLVDCFYE